MTSRGCQSWIPFPVRFLLVVARWDSDSKYVARVALYLVALILFKSGNNLITFIAHPFCWGSVECIYRQSKATLTLQPKVAQI